CIGRNRRHRWGLANGPVEAARFAGADLDGADWVNWADAGAGVDDGRPQSGGVLAWVFRLWNHLPGLGRRCGGPGARSDVAAHAWYDGGVLFIDNHRGDLGLRALLGRKDQ